MSAGFCLVAVSTLQVKQKGALVFRCVTVVDVHLPMLFPLCWDSARPNAVSVGFEVDLSEPNVVFVPQVPMCPCRELVGNPQCPQSGCEMSRGVCWALWNQSVVLFDFWSSLAGE